MPSTPNGFAKPATKSNKRLYTIIAASSLILALTWLMVQDPLTRAGERWFYSFFPDLNKMYQAETDAFQASLLPLAGTMPLQPARLIRAPSGQPTLLPFAKPMTSTLLTGPNSKL
ncbi:hypothetical protein HJC99_00905 [Candidatus Saccharibacteria bacterium]|nr:hypothetical protein [Candidatus Saccharibacteria bacterium]